MLATSLVYERVFLPRSLMLRKSWVARFALRLCSTIVSHCYFAYLFLSPAHFPYHIPRIFSFSHHNQTRDTWPNGKAPAHNSLAFPDGVSRNQWLQGINGFKESVGCAGNKESREKESVRRGRDAGNASSSLAVSILFLLFFSDGWMSSWVV